MNANIGAIVAADVPVNDSPIMDLTAEFDDIVVDYQMQERISAYEQELEAEASKALQCKLQQHENDLAQELSDHFGVCSAEVNSFLSVRMHEGAIERDEIRSHVAQRDAQFGTVMVDELVAYESQVQSQAAIKHRSELQDPANNVSSGFEQMYLCRVDTLNAENNTELQQLALENRPRCRLEWLEVEGKLEARWFDSIVK